MQPAVDAGTVEVQTLIRLAPLPERLGHAGLRAERRALVARPPGQQYRLSSGVLELQFELPRGAYATSFLREFVNASVPEVGVD
jgi:tRNA pseudouridine13 synthase